MHEWNLFDRVLAQAPRTNNAVEAWYGVVNRTAHRQFQHFRLSFKTKKKPHHRMYANEIRARAAPSEATRRDSVTENKTKTCSSPWPISRTSKATPSVIYTVYLIMLLTELA